MAYTVWMTPQAHKMFRRLAPDARRHVLTQARTLSDKPDLGQPLTGVLRAFRSLHTTHEGTHYRVVYERNHRTRRVIVRGAGPRENLYNRLRRMRLKPLAG